MSYVPKLDHTPAPTVARAAQALIRKDMGADEKGMQLSRSLLVSATVTEYFQGKVPHEDYASSLAEFLDPENFDFAEWRSKYQPPAELDDQGLKP